MTYMIADVTGLKGDLGNTATIAALQKVSQRQDLAALRRFLMYGMTTNIGGLLTDLDSVDFGFSDLADIVEEFKEVLRDSEEIVILTQ